MKIIGYCDTNEKNCKLSMDFVKLNYNFVHDVLKKIGARPELVAGNCRS